MSVTLLIVSSSSFFNFMLRLLSFAHSRSVAILCMVYMFRLAVYGALLVPYRGSYVPARVSRGALVAHRYTCAPPLYKTSQDCRTFILLSVSLCNDLADPLFDGAGLSGFKNRANAF